MAAKKLKPAELLIGRFGGQGEVARALKLQRSTPNKWVARGGAVPTKRQEQALRVAKELRIKLSAEELIYGGVL